jgi:hypothetical protein
MTLEERLHLLDYPAMDRSRRMPRGWLAAERAGHRCHLANVRLMLRNYVWGLISAEDLKELVAIGHYDQDPRFVHKINNWIRYHRRQERLRKKTV